MPDKLQCDDLAKMYKQMAERTPHAMQCTNQPESQRIKAVTPPPPPYSFAALQSISHLKNNQAKVTVQAAAVTSDW